MNTIRWGIMSSSRHAATSVIPAIHASPNGSVAAVASRDAARAQAFATENNIPSHYDSYEAMLADPDLDALYIPLPNNLHKEWAIRAAQAGKHVLCEKPLALNASEAEEMVHAFRAAGRKLAEAFQWRHHPQPQRLRQMVQDGVIGDIKLIEAGFSFTLARPGDIRWDPAMGGGSLYDVGCYPLAFTRYITGQEPCSVTAQADWAESGIDQQVIATLQFPNGVMATINCAFTLPVRRYYSVTGTKGTLSVLRAYNLKEGDPAAIMHYGPDNDLVDTIRLAPQNSYTLMIQDFNQAILDDRDPLFPGDDAIMNMRVIDAVLKAAQEGGTVML